MFFVLYNVSGFSSTNYVSLFLEGKISLQSLVSEFTYKGKYEELLNILDRILERTNMYEVRFEKVKIGYSLGKNILEEFYLIINTNVFDRIIFYSAIFFDKRFLDDFSSFVLDRNISDFWVINNLFRLCSLKNYFTPIVGIVVGMRITNGTLISELIDKLYSFFMYSDITNIFYSLREIYTFSEEDLLLVGRSLGELGDEECLKIFSKNNRSFVPFRIEFLIRFGYIDEGISEAKVGFLTPRLAKYLFIAFLNLGDYEEARMVLNYINIESFKLYFSYVLDLLMGRNLLQVEEKLKNLLKNPGIDLDVKNQVGFLLWIINTSNDKKTMEEEVIMSLNYFNGIKNHKYSSIRILEKLKAIKSLDSEMNR